MAKIHPRLRWRRAVMKIRVIRAFSGDLEAAFAARREQHAEELIMLRAGLLEYFVAAVDPSYELVRQGSLGELGNLLPIPAIVSG